MDYTQSDANVTDISTGKRMHQSTNPIATEVSPDDLNALNWELLELIKGADLVPSAFNKTVPATYSQVRDAVAVLSRKNSIASATGSADVLVGAYTPVVPELVNGLTLYLRAASANATATPTFTPHDGVIAAKDIVKGNGLALVDGDIAGAGHWLTLKYDLTLDKWVLMNPALGVGVFPVLSLSSGLSRVGYQSNRAAEAVKTAQAKMLEFVSPFDLNYLPNVSKTMLNGGAVNISCYGDSTTYGQSTGGMQAETPAPSRMQSLLRSYFNNTLITVVNKGVAGQTASQRLATFVADIAADASDVIFINYGLNDAVSYDPYLFKDYLVKLVKIARDAGKLCVLEASTPILYDGTNVNTQGVANAKVAQNAEIVRTVAKEFSISVVDKYRLYELLLSDSDAVLGGTTYGQPAYLADGVHSTQLGYDHIGAAMASVFMTPFRAKSPCVIPVNHGCSVMVGSSGSIFTPLALSGNLIINNSVSFAVKIDRTGLDIHAVMAINSALSGNVKITINALSKTVSCHDARVPVSYHVLQNEVLISTNVPPGDYVITITGNGSPVEVEGLRLRTSLKNSKAFTSNEEVSYASVNYGTLTSIHQWAAASIEAKKSIKIDNSSFDLEFKATLAANDGVALFCLPYTNGPTSGMWVPIVFQLDGAGHPTYSWNWILTGVTYVLNGPADTVVSTAVDYRSAEHTYRIHFDKITGSLTLFIDDVEIGSVVTIDVGSVVEGGFIATKKASAGQLRLRNVTYTPYFA